MSWSFSPASSRRRASSAAVQQQAVRQRAARPHGRVAAHEPLALGLGRVPAHAHARQQVPEAPEDHARQQLAGHLGVVQRGHAQAPVLGVQRGAVLVAVVHQFDYIWVSQQLTHKTVCKRSIEAICSEALHINDKDLHASTGLAVVRVRRRRLARGELQQREPAGGAQ
eukprot:CAMPEP_0194666306 /NCGR_PEP_ID=MMETSP0295-20121207/2641_1 /TAXON_ID=39354 /ORGANISM="Heterosigma akashiwo, Strain CCMP2393" /LENGTH=167 /DNA_ID=CAMNT_0039548539 /DNA_START=520 /DNA_END=1019 /DNA_ORIENTATION=+